LAAPLPLVHERDRGAGEMHGGQKVQLDRPMECLRGLLSERGGRGAARIAEQDVQASELVVHAGHEPGGLRFYADVGDERGHVLAGFGGELPRRLVHRVLMAAVQGHPGAFLRERLRHGAAEPLRAAAHECHAADETEIHGRESTERGRPRLG